MSVTIKDLGLHEYLEQTKSQHNDHGWDDFEDFMVRKVSRTAIAKIFGVTGQTAYNWAKKYNDERGSHVQEDVER